jgi:transglutaminase-like putative cysteine protease
LARIFKGGSVSSLRQNMSFIGALSATDLIDSTTPEIVEWAREKARRGSATSQAINLYYAVRDEIRYDPYGVVMRPDHFRASATLARGHGFCITKAILLAATARAIAIPARLGFADVKNHLTTPRLIERMGSDIFVYHGYVSLYLDGRWVKATPAFNIELTQRFGVKPLEFDGREDSIFHEFDMSGRRHMEYVQYRGEFDDVPFDDIAKAFRETYPRMTAEDGTMARGDFHAEARPMR